VKPLRPDEIERRIKEFEDGFSDMVVGMTMLVIGKLNASVVGELDGDSHTVILPSIIESFTFWGLGHGQL
jgi:hypothetical protein